MREITFGLDLDGTVTDIYRRVSQIYAEKKRSPLHYEDWVEYDMTSLGFSLEEVDGINSDPDTFRYMLPYPDFSEYGIPLVKKYHCPIITSRAHLRNGDVSHEVRWATHIWLAHEGIESDVYFARDKEEVCRELGLMGLIDDSPDHLLRCSGFRICRALPYNRCVEDRVMLRTDSWKKISETVERVISGLGYDHD